MSAREIQADDGAALAVPAALREAVDIAAGVALKLGDTTRADEQTVFEDTLVLALYNRRIVLVPIAFAGSREAVNLNIYTLALDQKHAAQRALQEVAAIFRSDPERAIGDLHGEFHAAVMALTGHAPMPGIGRVLGVEQRLRQLRELLLGIPLDQPEIPLPANAVEALATGGTT